MLRLQVQVDPRVRRKQLLAEAGVDPRHWIAEGLGTLALTAGSHASKIFN